MFVFVACELAYVREKLAQSLARHIDRIGLSLSVMGLFFPIPFLKLAVGNAQSATSYFLAYCPLLITD